jgi:hypothetical protein
MYSSGHVASLKLVISVPLLTPTMTGVSVPLATALAIAIGSERGA